jgi:hypothetical protein
MPRSAPRLLGGALPRQAGGPPGQPQVQKAAEIRRVNLILRNKFNNAFTIQSSIAYEKSLLGQLSENP